MLSPVLHCLLCRNLMNSIVHQCLLSLQYVYIHSICCVRSHDKSPSLSHKSSSFHVSTTLRTVHNVYKIRKPAPCHSSTAYWMTMQFKCHDNENNIFGPVRTTVNLIKIWDVIKCIAWILLISIVCNAYMISTRDEHKGSQNKNWPAAVIIFWVEKSSKNE